MDERRSAGNVPRSRLGVGLLHFFAPRDWIGTRVSSVRITRDCTCAIIGCSSGPSNFALAAIHAYIVLRPTCTHAM